MAGSFSDYLEALVLDEVFINISLVSDLWVSAATAAPDEDGSPTNEIASWTRVNFTDWSRTGSTVDNDSPVVLTNTSGGTQDVTHVLIFDASGGGNLLAWADLGTPRTVAPSDTITFAAGALVVTMA